MSECSWPTGAQSAGYFDGTNGKVSEFGAKFLQESYGSRGRSMYIFEYWCSFKARKGASDVCFIHYPNEREGTK